MKHNKFKNTVLSLFTIVTILLAPSDAFAGKRQGNTPGLDNNTGKWMASAPQRPKKRVKTNPNQIPKSLAENIESKGQFKESVQAGERLSSYRSQAIFWDRAALLAIQADGDTDQAGNKVSGAYDSAANVKQAAYGWYDQIGAVISEAKNDLGISDARAAELEALMKKLWKPVEGMKQLEMDHLPHASWYNNYAEAGGTSREGGELGLSRPTSYETHQGIYMPDKRKADGESKVDQTKELTRARIRTTGANEIMSQEMAGVFDESTPSFIASHSDFQGLSELHKQNATHLWGFTLNMLDSIRASEETADIMQELKDNYPKDFKRNGNHEEWGKRLTTTTKAARRKELTDSFEALMDLAMHDVHGNTWSQTQANTSLQNGKMPSFARDFVHYVTEKSTSIGTVPTELHGLANQMKTKMKTHFNCQRKRFAP